MSSVIILNLRFESSVIFRVVKLSGQDIVLTPKTENRLFFLWMKDMSSDFRWMRMNRSTLESR